MTNGNAARMYPRRVRKTTNEDGDAVNRRRTPLLIALVVAAGLAAAVAFSWLQKQRSAAEAAGRDLARCRADLADLARWNAAGSGDVPLTADSPELNRRLHDAAAEAGVPDELASIDPGQPRPVRDTDYAETLVFLRLNSVTLRQLVTFLHNLSAHDAGVRTRSIELGAPAGQGPDGGGDAWAADVTLAYLSYAPRARPNP